jgi:hypothetical protein
MWPNGVPVSWTKAIEGALPQESLIAQPRYTHSAPSEVVLPPPTFPSKAEQALLLETFHQIICDRFDEPALQELTRFRLNVRLDHIVSGENFRQTAYQLIEWADQRGRIAELARAVMGARPDLREVQEACSA